MLKQWLLLRVEDSHEHIFTLLAFIVHVIVYICKYEPDFVVVYSVNPTWSMKLVLSL